jgi:ABC-type bacteriocin/lantibiotic exporter with double-glycine peptidase domain
MMAVKQTDITDCGPACVQYLLAKYHRNIPLHTLKKHHALKIGYYNFLELSEILATYGLEAQGYQANIESLQNVSLPAIAQTYRRWQTHFIVIDTLVDDTITIMDPAKGRSIAMSTEEFNKVWSGKILVIEKDRQVDLLRTLTSAETALQKFFLNYRSTLTIIMATACILLMATWMVAVFNQ